MIPQKNCEKVLVVAAHPDDEVLGCGGTIARHIKNNDEVHIIILAEGITARAVTRDRQQHQDNLSELALAAHQANKILGVTSLYLHDFPDNRMDSIDRLDIVKMVESHIEKIKPTTVYTHHSGDVNIDHRRIHEAVVTACRPMPNFCVKKLLFFEVASSTEWQPSTSAPYFMPNVFIDVSQTLSLKLEALQAYSLEMRAYPHARSLEAIEYLARWRGATVGVVAAEAFVLGRCID